MRALVLLSLLALAACGQKGNLYLPDEDPEAVPATIGPVITTSPATTPATPAPPAPPAAPAAGSDDDRDDTQRN